MIDLGEMRSFEETTSLSLTVHPQDTLEKVKNMQKIGQFGRFVAKSQEKVFDVVFSPSLSITLNQPET